MKTEWGFSKFISKNDLTHPSNGYLIDDKCVFGAEQEFKIANFSTLKDKWTSDEFTVGGHKWEIWVYPNGNGEASGRSLSITP
ncbi:hypothetical protein PHJA_001436000 [Phtheirospermum japonicum]|uniref:MATH domain-containing protein n=1 Tax=Phtheirospermum japonicum TaxID=374723 RepID=A0A830BXS1_9LAMI|nr:hypothetical protein PHJA_001436000 [Phtheirospermum japonicum]